MMMLWSNVSSAIKKKDVRWNQNYSLSKSTALDKMLDDQILFPVYYNSAMAKKI